MDDDLRTADIKALYMWLDERMNQMGENQREAHGRLREDMRQGFQGVNARLDALNGKTSAHETRIAVLQDRSERAERQSGIIGSISGGGAAAIVMLIKAWMAGTR